MAAVLGRVAPPEDGGAQEASLYVAADRAGSHVDAVHVPLAVGRSADHAELRVDAVVVHEADPCGDQGPGVPTPLADVDPERARLDRTEIQGPGGSRGPEREDGQGGQQQQSGDSSLHYTSLKGSTGILTRFLVKF